MLDITTYGCPPGGFPGDDHTAALAHLLQDETAPPLHNDSEPASGDSANGNAVSSFRGVTFSKGQWTASVMVNGRCATFPPAPALTRAQF